MTLVAGVDSSTQSCTVVLHDESGTMLASASAPHVWLRHQSANRILRAGGCTFRSSS